MFNGVRIRFFEVLAAERLIDIHRELVRLNDDAVRTTEELENVGQANEPDLLQARVEARRARVALRNAENRYRGSWGRLVALVGAPELGPMPLDARLLEAPAARSTSTPRSSGSSARARRFRRHRRDSPQPDHGPPRARRADPEHHRPGHRRPQLRVQRHDRGRPASIPLPIFNRNQGTVREAQSDLTRDHAEHERVALSLRNGSPRPRPGTTTPCNRSRISAESLPTAHARYEIQLANFRAAASGVAQVLVAQRTYVELNREYVRSLLELRRAEVEIGGMLLVDGLTPPDPPTSQGHIEAVPQPR